MGEGISHTLTVIESLTQICSVEDDTTTSTLRSTLTSQLQLMAEIVGRSGEFAEITEKDTIWIVSADVGFFKDSNTRMMELLLDWRGDEVQVAEAVVIAAFEGIGLGGPSPGMIELLLDRRGGEVVITEGILSAAARSFTAGVDVMELLLRHCGGKVRITDAMIKAVRYKGFGIGGAVAELILDWQRRVEECAP